GRTVEAAGKSAASRELQRKMGSTLVRAVAREKAAPRRVIPGGRPQSARPSAIAPPPVNTSAFFKPDPRADTMARIADELGTNPTERQQLRQLFAATKTEFEKQVAAEGRSNNLPAAFTLFIVSTVTVYRDDPEPSDQVTDKLWDGMSGAMSEMPEMSNLSDAEKQQLYDMLIAFSGFVLAGYMESKTSGDVDTLKVFQTLSGELIRTVLKTDPATLRFSADGLEIVK
ncbi:MAG: DUF6683 family protein, partial [Pyrinomonadaceae bacterium]